MNGLVIIDFLSMALQFAALYFAYRIYRFNRLSKGWLALICAFFIQGIRRGVTMIQDTKLVDISAGITFDRALMFVISLLIVVGLWTMYKNFESFEVITKQIGKKLKKR